MSKDVTRRSLLLRVRDLADDDAWGEFEARYRDLIIRYARTRGLQPSDADDVCQIVMTKLSRAMRAFDYDPRKGRFRNYLHRIVQHEIIQQFARPKAPPRPLDTPVLASLSVDDGARADDVWEREWDNHHLRLAMRKARTAFDERSIAIFDRLLGGGSVQAAAEEFGTTTQAVYKIKQRIGARLRELIAKQIREEDDPEAPLG